MRKISGYLLCICVCAAILTGCGREKKLDAGAKSETVPVRVMKVKLEDLDKILEYVGNIKGQDEALVYPKVSGKVIEKIKEDGSMVKKGEAIAYIDRDEVGLKFEKAPVESPLAGIIGRVFVDIGSSVTPQTVIALISDIDKAEIDLNIPEKYLPKVSLGQEAEIIIDAYPEEKFTGKVTSISPVVDLATRSAPIEITINNRDHRLQSGMFAKVKLTIEKNKGVVVIFKEAVIGRAPDTYVYVVKDKKAVLRKIKLGIRQGAYCEVLDGLKEGELVVVMGQQRLSDGSSVEPEE